MKTRSRLLLALTVSTAVFTTAIFSASLAQANESSSDGMAIYGDLEQPKVLHIVPWKSVHQSIPSNQWHPALSDVIQPVDEAVLARESKYWEKTQPTPPAASDNVSLAEQ
jgi:hypothetical protein